MQKIYPFILVLIIISTFNNSNAQSVLNPADSVVTYNSAKPPAQPTYGQIGKWVRTKRLSWNTDSYKAYIYKGCAFRLKFSKGKTVLLNTSLNTTGTVTIYGVAPDENGEINISVAPGTTTSQFGLIGAMVVQGYNTPASSTIPNAPNSFVQQSIASVKTESAAKSAKPKNNTVKISAYPNPFTAYFNLSVSTPQADDVQIDIFSVNGKVVYRNKFSNIAAGSNNLKIQLNDQDLTAGMYIAKITFIKQNISQTLKLVKE